MWQCYWALVETGAVVTEHCLSPSALYGFSSSLSSSLALSHVLKTSVILWDGMTTFSHSLSLCIMAHTLAELRNSCFFAAATAVPLDTLSVSALGATSLVTLPGYGGRH